MPAPKRRKTADAPAFLSALRELVSCYQAFEAYSAAHIRQLDLTPPQFDVIATLGNTAGMSCKELGERTLTTKGTLTGILDRLEDKGLLRRVASVTDRRSLRVELTEPGATLFATVFPAHLAYLRPAFERVGDAALSDVESGLARLRQAFSDSLAENKQR